MKAVLSFRMPGASYQAMLFQIPERYCISLFVSNRPVTKPGPEERVASQVVPPTSEMAEMSLKEQPPVRKTVTSRQEHPPVRKTVTSRQEQPPVHRTGTSGKQ